MAMDAEPPEEPDNKLIENGEAETLREAHERRLNQSVNEVIEGRLAHETANRENRGKYREYGKRNKNWYEYGKRIGNSWRHRLRHLNTDFFIFRKLDENPRSNCRDDDGRQDCLIAEIIETKSTDFVAGLADDLTRRHDDERQQHREGITQGEQIAVAGNLTGQRHHDAFKFFYYRIHFPISP